MYNIKIFFIPPSLGNSALKGRVFSKDGLGRVRNSARNRKNSRALRPEFIINSQVPMKPR